MIKIKTPFVYDAYDYHVFADLKFTLNKLGDTKIKYKEINNSTYRAVFYEGKYPNQKIIDSLMR